MKKIAMLLFLGLGACHRDSLSLQSMLIQMEEQEGAKIDYEKSVELPALRFNVPPGAPRYKVMNLLYAYLDIHDLSVVQREGKLRIVTMDAFQKLWSEDISGGIKRAIAEKKPLILRFTSNAWCQDCNIQDRVLYRDERIVKELGDYVLLRSNGEGLQKLLLEDPNVKKLMDRAKPDHSIGVNLPTLFLFSGSELQVLEGASEDGTMYWNVLRSFKEHGAVQP